MRRAFLELHIAVFLFGFTAILGKLISIPEGPLVFIRTGLASLSLLPLIFLRKGYLLVDWKKILQYAGIGMIIVTHWILFYGSIKVSNVSIALSCLASASLFSAIIEPLIMKKSFNIVEIALGVLVIFGIYLIFTFHNFYLKGILMGIGSAFFAALFSVLNKKIINNSDTYVASFWELLSGFVFLGLIGLIAGISETNLWVQPTFNDWIYLLILSFACTTLAYTLSLNSLRHISAFTANLTINLEPVYGILLAFFLLGESKQLHPGFFVGTLIIFSSVVIHGYLQWRKQKKQIREVLP
jgi:drug/metabolite transporter (DMT)-like permease